MLMMEKRGLMEKNKSVVASRTKTKTKNRAIPRGERESASLSSQTPPLLFVVISRRACLFFRKRGNWYRGQQTQGRERIRADATRLIADSMAASSLSLSAVILREREQSFSLSKSARDCR